MFVRAKENKMSNNWKGSERRVIFFNEEEKNPTYAYLNSIQKKYRTIQQT